MHTRSSALALIACDRPRLSRAHIDRLIVLHRHTGRPATSRYAGAAGVPAVFGAREFAALATLSGGTATQKIDGSTP
jgi:CTP:molybdopterin cytidylyltransferase MocA